MTMLERVARAMYEENIRQIRCDIPRMEIRTASWNELGSLQEVWRNNARAALEAMREPTEQMARAAYRADGTNMSLAIAYEDVYRAMISAALSESKESSK